MILDTKTLLGKVWIYKIIKVNQWPDPKYFYSFLIDYYNFKVAKLRIGKTKSVKF